VPALAPSSPHNIIPLPLESAREAQLLALRELLAGKYPEEAPHRSGFLETGVEAVDRIEGGLRLGALTEISGSAAGNSLLLQTLLERLRRQQRLGALIDCGAFFDPDSFHPASLPRLLWVQCATPAVAAKAADLLLRDGNLSLLLLDLQDARPRELRRVPASTWHRFQRLVEPSNTALVVFTRQPIVESAAVRIATTWPRNFAALTARRSQLLAALETRVFPRRRLALPTVFAEQRIA
jgi:hypothetical protein